MYRVLDICRYIIKLSNEKEYGVSNLKLQKLLYFIQAYFLMNSKEQEPCFDEPIEAWDFGPVVPVAYHEYKQYGSTDIPFTDSYFDFNEDDPWNSLIREFDEDCIDKADRILIDDVVHMLADYSATDLVNITHKQAPWKDVYVRYQNNIITIDSMRRYFSEKE